MVLPLCMGVESTTLAWAAFQQPHPSRKNKRSHSILSHHPLPLFPPLGVGPHDPLTHPCRLLTGWIGCRRCAGSHSCYELMSTAAQKTAFHVLVLLHISFELQSQFSKVSRYSTSVFPVTISLPIHSTCVSYVKVCHNHLCCSQAWTLAIVGLSSLGDTLGLRGAMGDLPLKTHLHT